MADAPKIGRPSPRRLVTALGVVVLVGITALLLDSRVNSLAAHWKCSLIDNLVAVLNPIGSGLTLLIICVALGAVCRALPPSPLGTASWLSALAFSCAGLVEFAIKHLVGRPRPVTALPTFAMGGPSFVPEIDSFPSGHATSVFAVATVFGAFYPRFRWPLYTVAAAVAVGRVYLDRHYLSDILAGAAIGIAIAMSLLHYHRTLWNPTTLESRADLRS
jgi:membrane-associated phospholipid phosphatase